MTTKEIADRLVALCRAGRNLEAVETLLSEDVVSVEATGDETMPAVQTGRDAVLGKNNWWLQNHQIHSAQVKGPFPNEDRFTVIYDFVVTPKSGPMAGRKMRMEEVALYTVSDGKITREEFFYDMSGGGGELPAEKPAKKREKKAKAKARAKAKKTASKARTSNPKAKAKVSKPKAKTKKGKPKSKGRRR